VGRGDGGVTASLSGRLIGSGATGCGVEVRVLFYRGRRQWGKSCDISSCRRLGVGARRRRTGGGLAARR
jgi:hypothetical protein